MDDWEGELGSAWLTVEEIDALYSVTDWGPILRGCKHKWVDTKGRFSILSMFKALALPFLVPIASEHALARELAERSPLRAVCGFLHHITPTRAMFWHFRNHDSEVFKTNIVQVLMLLTLAGQQLGFCLPFARTVPSTLSPGTEPWLSFSVSPEPSLVSIWKKKRLHQERLIQLTHEEKQDDSDRNGHIGMFSGLGFPFLAAVRYPSKSSVCFVLDKPEWLDFRKPLSDSLTVVGSSSRDRPYVVTHAIICRGNGQQREVLMGISASGSARSAYTLPGGTLMAGETFEGCVAREVAEETGLRVRTSRPVSFFFARFRGKPFVLNVVAWVNRYSGKVENCEPMNFIDWVWLRLGDIPWRLTLDVFPPALIAIRHFHELRYGRLRWETFEEDTTAKEIAPLETAIPGALPLAFWENSTENRKGKGMK